jgi:hypothetical protein
MRNLYLIDDGEQHHVSAENEEAAFLVMARNSGRKTALEYLEEMDGVTIRIVDRDDVIRVSEGESADSPYVEKTAGEWAGEVAGLVCTSCI